MQKLLVIIYKTKSKIHLQNLWATFMLSLFIIYIDGNLPLK